MLKNEAAWKRFVDTPVALSPFIGHRRLIVGAPNGAATCTTCGAVINEAQAGLSQARADGAPAECKDCCTAKLTRALSEEERRALIYAPFPIIRITSPRGNSQAPNNLLTHTHIEDGEY